MWLSKTFERIDKRHVSRLVRQSDEQVCEWVNRFRRDNPWYNCQGEQWNVDKREIFVNHWSLNRSDLILIKTLSFILLHLWLWWGSAYYASVLLDPITLMSNMPLYDWLWIRICLMHLCTFDSDYESVWYISVRLTLIVDLSDIILYFWLRLRICLT